MITLNKEQREKLLNKIESVGGFGKLKGSEAFIGSAGKCMLDDMNVCKIIYTAYGNPSVYFNDIILDEVTCNVVTKLREEQAQTERENNEHQQTQTLLELLDS